MRMQSWRERELVMCATREDSEVHVWNVMPKRCGKLIITKRLRKLASRAAGLAGVPDRDPSKGLDQSSSAPLTPDRTDAPHDLTTATSTWPTPGCNHPQT